MNPFDEGFLGSLSRLALAVERLRAREGEGGPRADRRGGRVEFAEHRAYAPGDDPRLIDWAAYARTGRFFVREFERREELSVLLLVDSSASMGLHGKLVAAQRLAYALAYLGLSAGSRVRAGLCAGGALRVSSEVSGTPRIADLGAFLASAAPAGSTRLTESLARVPPTRRGSRVLVLVSDLLAEDDGRAALGTLCRRGDEVDVVHVRARGDVELPEETPLWLEDAETGAVVGLPAGAAAALAREDSALREREWRAFAGRHGARYVPVDAAASTEEIVLRTLRSGGIVA